VLEPAKAAASAAAVAIFEKRIIVSLQRLN